jgi:PTH1 family peptidyl-tRNA hydrolase
MMVVGLGNPGRRYEATRHNVGFLVVDELARRWGINPEAKKQFGALVGDGRVGKARTLLCRPQTFMNRSGQPARSVAGYYGVESDAVVTIHDDLDLPYGTVRCKRGGGHGGHNGLRDMITHMGKDFLRVRCGVGRPPEGWDTAAYVLGKWSTDEKTGLDPFVGEAADAVESVLDQGIEQAMNTFNVRDQSGPVQADTESPS